MSNNETFEVVMIDVWLTSASSLRVGRLALSAVSFTRFRISGLALP
jgi:hypothetical protein